MPLNEEEIRQRNKDTHQKSARYWIGLANSQAFEINKQFLTFAALLLTLSTSIIALNNPNNLNYFKLSEIEKAFLLIVWFFLIISLISGIIQIIVDVNFFVYLCRDEGKREATWSQLGKSIAQLWDEEKAIGRTKKNSTFLPLILQGVFLSLAICFLIVIGIFILY